MPAVDPITARWKAGVTGLYVLREPSVEEGPILALLDGGRSTGMNNALGFV